MPPSRSQGFACGSPARADAAGWSPARGSQSPRRRASAPQAKPHRGELEAALQRGTQRAPPPPPALASTRHLRRPPDDRRRGPPLHGSNTYRLASSAVRWAALVSVAAGVGIALSVAQLAPGQSIDRVRVSPNPPVASVPPGLFLVVGSPDSYSRSSVSGGRGSWVGPGYAPLGAPNPSGNAAIDWEVGYDTRPLDTERVALANLTRDWQEDQRAGASIPHIVGGRVVGDIPGFFVLQVERRSAPSELVVAFPLSRDVHAYVRFLLTRPESNDFYVNGSILASSWNRGQAFVAMSRVRLEGNLPPSLVSIRARPWPGCLRVRARLRAPPGHRNPGRARAAERPRLAPRRDRTHDAHRRLPVQRRAGQVSRPRPARVAVLGDERLCPRSRRELARSLPRG